MSEIDREPPRTHILGGFCASRRRSLAAELPPEKLVQQISTAEAAHLAGVKISTIRKWVQRGHLPVADRDLRGRPLFKWIDVAKAEHATRVHAHRSYAA